MSLKFEFNFEFKLNNLGSFFMIMCPFWLHFPKLLFNFVVGIWMGHLRQLFNQATLDWTNQFRLVACFNP